MSEAQEGPPVLVKGKVVFGREESLYPAGKECSRISIRDARREWNSSGSITGDPIFPNWLKKPELLAYGVVTMNRGYRQIVHPEIRVVRRNRKRTGWGFILSTRAIDGIPSSILRSAISRAT